MSGHAAQIFAEGDYLAGTLAWGWQCFTCRAEETGLGSATAAQHYAVEHVVDPAAHAARARNALHTHNGDQQTGAGA